MPKGDGRETPITDSLNAKETTVNENTHENPTPEAEAVQHVDSDIAKEMADAASEEAQEEQHQTAEAAAQVDDDSPIYSLRALRENPDQADVYDKLGPEKLFARYLAIMNLGHIEHIDELTYDRLKAQANVAEMPIEMVGMLRNGPATGWDSVDLDNLTTAHIVALLEGFDQDFGSEAEARKNEDGDGGFHRSDDREDEMAMVMLGILNTVMGYLIHSGAISQSIGDKLMCMLPSILDSAFSRSIIVPFDELAHPSGARKNLNVNELISKNALDPLYAITLQQKWAEDEGHEFDAGCLGYMEYMRGMFSVILSSRASKPRGGGLGDLFAMMHGGQ